MNPRYIDTHCSMQHVEFNRKSLWGKFKNQGKYITLCNVPAHLGTNGNEAEDKAAK